MTMHYFGPSLNLSSDQFADADEVTVEQPPTGCGTVTVFRDVVLRDSEYSHLISPSRMSELTTRTQSGMKA